MLRFPTAAGVMNGLLLLLIGLAQTGCRHGAPYYLEAGNRYYAQGRYADASINYRKSLQKDPKSAEAHYRLGLAEMKQGFDRSAYLEFRLGTQLAPDRDDIRIQAADAALNGYETSKDKPKVLYDDLAGTAEYLLRTNPNSFDGLRLRADMLSLDGRLEDALAVFKQANSVRPLDPGVIYPMLQVQLRLKQTREAEDLAKKFLQTHKDASKVYDILAALYVEESRLSEAEQILKSKIANLPKESRPLVQLADFYWRQQRPREMSETLNRILSDKKDFPQGRAIVGDFYIGIAKPDEAMQQYTEGMRSDAKDTALYQKRIVKVLVGQGKREAAIETLDRILKTNPEDLDSRTARAILLRGSRDLNQVNLAIADLNLVIEKNPQDEVAKYNLGLAYLSKGDRGAAKKLLLESAKANNLYLPSRNALAEMAQQDRNYPETIRLAEEMLAIDPGNADARLWHAAGLLGSKNYAQARNELNALLRDYPESVNVNLHLAVLDMEEKRYKEAEERYLRLYKPNQADVRPLEGLVQLYIQEREFDKALKLLDQEVKLAPDSRAVHLLMASTAAQAGKLDLATQQYEWLGSNDPNSVQAYTSLGDLYQLKGDINSALASYEKARALAPNDPRIIAMLAFLQSAAGQNSLAIANLRKQLAIDPENAIAMNNLAFALSDSGANLDEAVSLAERAQKKAPDNPGIQDTLAWAYTKKGLNDSAIQILNGLVKKFPNEPSFRYHLGVALLQKGEASEAKTEFIISLSNKPPKDVADKIRQIIAKIG